VPVQRIDEKSVFLNVPFDRTYEPLFVALIAVLISIGRKPRCVLEIPDLGVGRLARIVGLIQRCAVSIHDLSRVGNPARFNMPFELGLACAVAELKPPHAYVLLEKQQYRLDSTLSDVKGRDPFIHAGGVCRLIGCVLDALRSRTNNPNPEAVFRLYRNLRVVAKDLKNRYRVTDLYTRSIFEELVAAGTELATRARFIAA
jgi:hypothetical protein